MSVTKRYHSPFQVTYGDLIADAEERLKALERASGWDGQHKREVVKKELALFKKFKKDPQVNLFDEFEKTNGCGKRKLSQEMAERIVARDEIEALNTGNHHGKQRVAYHCNSCNAWHTSTMISDKPNLKTK